MKKFESPKEARDYMREKDCFILVWFHSKTMLTLRTTRQGNVFSTIVAPALAKRRRKP